MLTPYSTLTSYSTSYTKLATTPPPLHTRQTALAIKCAPCAHTPRGTDGDAAWRGEMSHRNARVDHIATNAHHPHLPASEARKGRGEGWRGLPIGGDGKTRPEEGGAKRLKARVVRDRGGRERLTRGRAGEAHVEKDVLEERTWLEKRTWLERHTLSRGAKNARHERS